MTKFEEWLDKAFPINDKTHERWRRALSPLLQKAFDAGFCMGSDCQLELADKIKVTVPND